MRRPVMEVLVCCHRNVVEVHIRQVPVAVLMVVEVDTDGLALVGSQVKRLLGPSVTVGGDLHDLRQQGARRVLYLGLLPVVRNRVGGGRPVPEGESSAGPGGASGIAPTKATRAN